MFDIRFDSTEHETDDQLVVGTIVLGSHKETFEACLCLWSGHDCELHWRHAIRRLLEGAESTALITQMHDPPDTNFITWWPAYRFGSEVRFNNQLLFLESLDSALDPDSPFEHVSSYEPIDEDGRRVSEWTIGIEAIREFHNSRGLST